MPDRWINWGLISNPANWLVVFLMLAIASIGITAIYSAWTTPNT
jgi:hypothetical protein